MPFTLKPVLGEDLIGRKEILKEMEETLVDKRLHVGYALYGVRRIGKTSILRELERRLDKRPDIIPVYFSLWEIAPARVEVFLKEFVVHILEKYKEVLGIKHKIRELMKAPLGVIKEVLKDAKIGFYLQTDLEVFFALKRGDVTSQLIRKAFELPEKLAEKTKTKCVLMIDEFPDILELRNGEKIGQEVVRLFRTMHEEYKRTTLCVSGSFRKTMDAAVLKDVSPFYKQLIPKEIKPLTESEVGSLMKKNLLEYDMTITKEAVGGLYKWTCGIPFYIQYLGIKLPHKRATKIEKLHITDTVCKFLMQEGDLFFSEHFERLSAKDKDFLVVMAAYGLTNCTKISKATGDPVTTVSRYMEYLINKGVIIKEARGTYDFVDNMFKQWLIRRFKPLF